MIYILLGCTASGKDTIASKLAQSGYKRIVTYTSRPKRSGEKDGISYNFVTKKAFERLISLNFFAEWRAYDTVDGIWYYGSSVESYELNNEDKIIILNPDGFRQIKKILNTENIKSIYVYSNIETIKNRSKKRGDKKEEAERRIEHDLIDFEGLENEVDKVIYNNMCDDINDVIQQILSYIEENKNRRIG